MKIFAKLLLLCTVLSVQEVLAQDEITGILERSQDLTPEEITALRPIFDELQSQYDYIVSEAAQDGDDITDPEFNKSYDAIRHEFEQHFAALIHQEQPSIEYDTRLPTVEELIGTPNTAEMSPEQLNELIDMQSILEDTLDEAQKNINELVKQALQMESNLLKLNKPKIIMAILEGLTVIFKISARGARAAYCTYSQIPQLNASLHNIYDGIDCYTYTTGLVVRIQNEVVLTVKTIKANIFDLADVYKKVASKNSIFGKILSLILNVTKIARDITNSYAVAMKAMDDLQNEVPAAAMKSVNCAMSFGNNLPQMAEAVTNVTTCILFVEEPTTDYDFMQPEEEDDL